MSKLENKSIAAIPPGLPVKYAILHQAVSWYGIVNTEKTLNQDKAKGVRMSLSPLGLVLEHKGEFAVIPSANVALAVLES